MPGVNDSGSALDRHREGLAFPPPSGERPGTPFCYVAKLELIPPVRRTSESASLSPEAGLQLRLTDIEQPPHRPTLPPDLNRAGLILWGLYKLCVGTKGQVTKITTIKPADDDALDDDWAKAMRTWRTNLTVVNGPHRRLLRRAARVRRGIDLLT